MQYELKHEKLLKPPEAAVLLAISTKQLHALTVAGDIPFVDIGLGTKRPTRRYRRQDIQDFILSRRTVSQFAIRTGFSLPEAKAPYDASLDFAKLRADLKKAKASKKR